MLLKDMFENGYGDATYYSHLHALDESARRALLARPTASAFTNGRTDIESSL
jgi:hypothetical protein